MKSEKHKQTSNLLLGPTVDSSGPQSESESHSAVYHSLRPHGLYSPRKCPGQNIGVDCHFLLQGISPTQEWNQSLLCVAYVIGRFFTTESSGKLRKSGFYCANYNFPLLSIPVI